MSEIIGIDLGTSNSCAAVVIGGRPEMIPNVLGNLLTPSVVRIDAGGVAVVGEHALRERPLYPASTVTGVKRLIGRRYNEVFDIAEGLPYEILCGDRNLAVVRIDGVTYTPQFISALILRSLKRDAEAFLGGPVSRAVITVPAYFNEIQREATREAGRIAGFEVMRLVNEPTAASMAYGLGVQHDEVVAVFDLGGGTMDVSILEIGEGVEDVKSTAGDGFLGGDDFDELVAEWIVEDVIVRYGVDLSADDAAVVRVRDAAVAAKHELSEVESVQIFVPNLLPGSPAPGFSATLTRTLFNEIAAELFQRLAGPCARALADRADESDLKKPVDRLLLVGGATRMTRVAEVAREAFGREPSRAVNPDEAVALGAAVQAGVMAGRVRDMLLLDVVSASLGVEIEGGRVQRLIPRNTTIPTRHSETFTTIAEHQTSVEVRIVQGEDERAEANRTLGRLVLRDLTAMGSRPQIEVTFDLEANGLLRASARDLVSGREATQMVEPDTGLTGESLAAIAARVSVIRLA